MRSAVAALGTLALLAALAAPAQEPPKRPFRYLPGQVVGLIVPNYPEAELGRGETATVEIRGTVQPDGRLRPLEITSTPPSPAFEAATREVAEHWLLHPGVQECRLVPTPTQVTLWFEIEDGKPKISYGALKPTEAAIREMEERLAFGEKFRPTRRVKPEYPSHIRSRNTPDQLFQYAYVGVGTDGKVTSVEVAPMRGYRDFEASMKRALSRWEFAPPDKPWCGTILIDFRLTG